MSSTRREFLRALGVTGALGVAPSFVQARGLEALGAEPEPVPGPGQDAGPIRLDSNENPLGPGARVLAAVQNAFAGVSRYPRHEPDLIAVLGRSLGIPAERLLLGAGSTEILVTAVRAFTGPDRAMVTAHPTFEAPATAAERLGHPVRAVSVSATLALDLDAMATAARGAGLVFLCNPNNPTGTMHGAVAIREFVARVHAVSPDAIVLIDEAYHDYVTDPAYATAIPLAMADARVVVARTFSKAYGIAGLRLGYAVGHAATLARMEPYRLTFGISGLALAAGQALLADPGFAERERRRNTEVREYTRAELARLGFPAPVSHANFIMVDIKRDSRAFRAACADLGVRVGRPFPPLERWSRISIGTMAEMQSAMRVFARLLA